MSTVGGLPGLSIPGNLRPAHGLPSVADCRPSPLWRLTSHGFRIDVAKRRYRPLGRALRGLIREPRCWQQGIVTMEIRALYGFDTVIWATRPHFG